MIFCEWENWNGYFVSGKLKNYTRLQNTHTAHSTTHTLNFRTKIQIFSLLLSLKSPNFPKPKPKIFIIVMDHQEQEALKFFADFIRQETAARESGSESVEQLEVLKESRVNFNNMAANKMDLRQDVAFQGWGKFFERLNGPIYEKIVK